MKNVSASLRCTTFVVVLMLPGVGCSKDPHKLKITDQNKDSFMEQLKDTKGLTLEEFGLLTSFQMRRAAAAALKTTEPPIVGKTVGEVIAEERKLQTDAKAKEEEQKRLAAEAKAKADAMAAQMREAIALTVFDKGFTPSNPIGGRFEDYITLKCAYENKSGRDVRAFTGSVQFTDLFGKEIFTTHLTISDPIGAGQKSTWEGAIKYNQFIGTHQALRNASLDNMKIVWLPDEILFADGSKLGGESGAK
jgi:hypothetical protein